MIILERFIRNLALHYFDSIQKFSKIFYIYYYIQSENFIIYIFFLTHMNIQWIHTMNKNVIFNKFLKL